MTIKYEYAEDIKKIAEQVIEEVEELKHINLKNIDFVRTSKHISRDYILARCRLLDDLIQFITDKKYIIECPPIFDTLKETTKFIVIEHELYHIPDDEKGLIQHNVGEFMSIIKKYGLNYVNEYELATKKVKKLKEIEKKKKQQEKIEEEKDEIIRGDENDKK